MHAGDRPTHPFRTAMHIGPDPEGADLRASEQPLPAHARARGHPPPPLGAPSRACCRLPRAGSFSEVTILDSRATCGSRSGNWRRATGLARPANALDARISVALPRSRRDPRMLQGRPRSRSPRTDGTIRGRRARRGSSAPPPARRRPPWLLRSARRTTPVTPIGIHGGTSTSSIAAALLDPQRAVDGDVDERGRRSGLDEHFALANAYAPHVLERLAAVDAGHPHPVGVQRVQDLGRLLALRGDRNRLEVPRPLGRRCVLEARDHEDPPAEARVDRELRTRPPTPRKPGSSAGRSSSTRIEPGVACRRRQIGGLTPDGERPEHVGADVGHDPRRGVAGRCGRRIRAEPPPVERDAHVTVRRDHRASGRLPHRRCTDCRHGGGTTGRRRGGAE